MEKEKLFKNYYDLECAYLKGYISIDTYINECRRFTQESKKEMERYELATKRKKQTWET